MEKLTNNLTSAAVLATDTCLDNKIFIIGLPRTGTTSLSITLLSLGYRVAHTAYTHLAFSQAQVISDTPIFCDYQVLAQHYPNSRFIYLTRELPLWLPSIKKLLNRMFVNVDRTDGGFNPIIKRCYQTVFHPFTLSNINNDDFLSDCYLQHQQQVLNFFSVEKKQYAHNDLNLNNAFNLNKDLNLSEVNSALPAKDRLLILNLTETNGFQTLLDFLMLPHMDNEFAHVNRLGKVTAWNDVKHPLKVASTRNGRVDTLPYG